MKTIPTITDKRLRLVWQQLDMACKGGKPRIEYCADGDGMIVVRESKEGRKLFDQSIFVCMVSGSLIDALASAENYLKKNGYEDFFPPV